MNLTCLKTTFNNSTIEKAKEMKIENISCFSSLSKENLEFGKVERRLLLYTTDSNEKIYIQYPGKETISSDDTKIRPWDFRPKLQLSNGLFMKDLSFADVWDDLSEMRESNEEVLSLLATLFFRMSQLNDYVLAKDNYDFIDIDINSGEIIKSGKISFTWQKPSFDKEILNKIQDVIGIEKTRNASLEAYLVYNDLLAQNEDCKYFYRAMIKNENWDSKVGRRNNLFTHINIIGYLQGHVKFSEIMNKMQYGVSPCLIKDIPIITNGLVSRE